MQYLEKYDVIVVGGGPGGFPAAVAAARSGMKTLLIERGAYLGGVMATGVPPLAYNDRTGNRVVGGIAQELADRLRAEGAATEHMPVPIQNCMTMMNPGFVRMTTLEMCLEAGVHILFYADVEGVCVQNERVTGINILCKGSHLHFDCSVAIDATGDGAVVAASGAAFVKEETLQPPTLIFHLGNVDMEEAAEFLRAHPGTYELPSTFPGIYQDIDLTRRSKNWCIMAYFDLIREAKAKGEFNVPRDMIDFVIAMNRNEVIVNVTRAPGTDTSDYASATEAEIECTRQIREVYRFMRKYVPGFENCVIQSVAPCIGPRESRKLAGLKTLTQDALKNLDIPEDTVALCGYNVDIHGANKSVQDHDSTSINMSITPIEHAIGVPYGCLVPVRMKGLLVSGRLISVDKIIYGMTRIMPTGMACGQAAGIAAAMAIKQGIEVADVDVQALRSEIVREGGYVSLK